MQNYGCRARVWLWMCVCVCERRRRHIAPWTVRMSLTKRIKWNKTNASSSSSIHLPDNGIGYTDAVVPVPLHIQAVSKRCHPTSAINARGSFGSFTFFFSAFLKAAAARPTPTSNRWESLPSQSCQVFCMRLAKCYIFLCFYFVVVSLSMSSYFLLPKGKGRTAAKWKCGKRSGTAAAAASGWMWNVECEWAIKIIKHLENYLCNVNRIESKSQQLFKLTFFCLLPGKLHGNGGRGYFVGAENAWTVNRTGEKSNTENKFVR